MDWWHVPDRPDPNVNHLAWIVAFSGLDLRALSFYGFRKFPSAESFGRLGSTMINLKVLRCSEFDKLRDLDPVDIAHAFPRLDELDVKYPMD